MERIEGDWRIGLESGPCFFLFFCPSVVALSRFGSIVPAKAARESSPLILDRCSQSGSYYNDHCTANYYNACAHEFFHAYHPPLPSCMYPSRAILDGRRNSPRMVLRGRMELRGRRIGQPIIVRTHAYYCRMHGFSRRRVSMSACMMTPASTLLCFAEN